MSTRPTFEDRLLGELKREIELREPEPNPSARRLFTPRRIALAAAACALAGLTTVEVPGPSADSTAYAVAHHGDGSVTLTVRDQTIDFEAQQELARKVRPWGILVTIDVLPPGHVCERSKVTPLPAVDGQGNLVPLIPIKASWDMTLRRGNVLAFENTKGDSRPRAVEFYKTKSEAEPCVPLKLTLPDNWPTD